MEKIKKDLKNEKEKVILKQRKDNKKINQKNQKLFHIETTGKSKKIAVNVLNEDNKRNNPIFNIKRAINEESIQGEGKNQIFYK